MSLLKNYFKTLIILFTVFYSFNSFSDINAYKKVSNYSDYVICLRSEWREDNIKYLKEAQRRDLDCGVKKKSKSIVLTKKNFLILKATGNSWVEIEDINGTMLFSRLMTKGDSYEVPDKSGLTINSGNAGALSIYSDKIIITSLGKIGELLHYQPLNIQALKKKSGIILTDISKKGTKSSSYKKNNKKLTSISSLYKGLFNYDDICDKAVTSERTWETHSDLKEFVDEAKRLGLGLDCEDRVSNNILGVSKKNTESNPSVSLADFNASKRQVEFERQKRIKLEIEVAKYKELLKNSKRGIQSVTDKKEALDSNNFNFYALVIGIDIYNSLDNLKTPLNDINEISKILRNKFNFKITKLVNPTKDKITLELSKLSNVMKKNDSLLIYYAGHGNMKENDGYWMAKDADPKISSTWISNDLISRELKYNKATNILVIADSCYSGTLTRGKSDIILKPSQKVLKSFMKTRSRMVISSGGLYPVLDGGGGKHSVFASSILTELRKMVSPTTSSELYTSIVQKVTKLSQNLGLEQKPMLSSIVKSIHNGPDFVFIPKDM